LGPKLRGETKKRKLHAGKNKGTSEGPQRGKKAGKFGRKKGVATKMKSWGGIAYSREILCRRKERSLISGREKQT